MLYSECIDLFLDYVSSYAALSTVEYYKTNLDFFSKYILKVKNTLDFNVQELTKSDYVGYISCQRKKKIKNTSVRTYSRAVKVFLRYLYNENLIKDNITNNVKMPYPDNRIIVPLSSYDVVCIMRGIANSPLRYRNLLIFRLMLDCGLRKSEVINLNIGDINLKDNYIVISNSKYNKSRFIPLPEVVKRAVLFYLNDRHSSCNALILSGDNRITDKAINCIFYKLKKYCSKNIYPHLLRHTFATSFIMRGGSLEVLRVLLGHSDYDVTRQYIHIAGQTDISNICIYRIDDCFLKAYKFNI